MDKSIESLVADPHFSASFATPDDAVVAMLLTPAMRENVDEIERRLLEANIDQLDAPIIRRFAPGIYIRELTLPKGGFAIGAYHLTETLNIMLTGRVTVLNDNGTTTELVAPMVFTSKPGRKIGYVHEDTVWQNVYPTDETDIEALERKYIVRSQAYLDSERKRREKFDLMVEADRLDYYRVLSEFDIPHSVARMETERTIDLIPFPSGSYKVMVSDSRIDGRGLFATAGIKSGELIAPVRIGLNRTPAGRYTNHSATPNAEFRVTPTGLDLYAIKDIAGCSGGKIGEEITIDYRKGLEIRRKLCHQQD